MKLVCDPSQCVPWVTNYPSAPSGMWLRCFSRESFRRMDNGLQSKFLHVTSGSTLSTSSTPHAPARSFPLQYYLYLLFLCLIIFIFICFFIFWKMYTKFLYHNFLTHALFFVLKSHHDPTIPPRMTLKPVACSTHRLNLNLVDTQILTRFSSKW